LLLLCCEACPFFEILEIELLSLLDKLAWLVILELFVSLELFFFLI
jgi:hypothetical protein